MRRGATLGSEVRVGVISLASLHSGSDLSTFTSQELDLFQLISYNIYYDMKMIYKLKSNDAWAASPMRMGAGASSRIAALVTRREDHRDTSGVSRVVPLDGGDIHVRIASERAELSKGRCPLKSAGIRQASCKS